MGNCSLKGGAVQEANSIRVLTEAGQIMDFEAPKLARDITDGFPGYGICRRGHASTPLPQDERLLNGGFYYLLPLHNFHQAALNKVEVDPVEPPKMSSADFVDNLSSGPSSSSALEVLSSEKNGVWKVKLVISSQQLEDILSQQVNTEALIEKMRMAAAANSGAVTPRRSKWWFWVVARKKPAVSSLFKVAVDKNKSP